MKVKEIISEIVKIPQSEIKVSKSDMPSYKEGDLKKFKPLPGESKFVYDIVKMTSSRFVIVIADPETKRGVGYLSLSKNEYFPIANAHYVDMIGVDPQRRGEGIAKSLYGIYLSILRYPLLAGTDQTPGGRRNWLSLSQIPGVEIQGYVAINDKYFDQDKNRPDYQNKKFDKLLDNIMAMGGEYLGENRGVHFFSFDVEPGTGELEPVVKKQLKLYGYHDLVNPGLYAVWQGK